MKQKQNLQKFRKEKCMFKVVVMDKPGIKLPKDDIFFMVGRGGIFMHKRMGLISGIVKVPDISFLEPVETGVELNVPKIPRDVFVQSLSFFRWAQKKYRSEAGVLVHYNPENQKFLLHCPFQEVSGAHVDYVADDRFEGFQLVCSIHSHNNFSAFHSGIDRNDEVYFDGLHITIGDVDEEYFTLVSSIVVNNNRFEVEPHTVIEGIHEIEYVKPEEPEAEEVEILAVGEDESDGFEDQEEVEFATDFDELPKGGFDADELTDEEYLEAISGGAMGFGGGMGFAAVAGGGVHIVSNRYVRPKVYDICYEGGNVSCQKAWKHPKEWRKRVREAKGNVVGINGRNIKEKILRNRQKSKGRKVRNGRKITPSTPRFASVNAIVNAANSGVGGGRSASGVGSSRRRIKKNRTRRIK